MVLVGYPNGLLFSLAVNGAAADPREVSILDGTGGRIGLEPQEIHAAIVRRNLDPELRGATRWHWENFGGSVQKRNRPDAISVVFPATPGRPDGQPVNRHEPCCPMGCRGLSRSTGVAAFDRVGISAFGRLLKKVELAAGCIVRQPTWPSVAQQLCFDGNGPRNPKISPPTRLNGDGASTLRAHCFEKAAESRRHPELRNGIEFLE